MTSGRGIRCRNPSRQIAPKNDIRSSAAGKAPEAPDRPQRLVYYPGGDLSRSAENASTRMGARTGQKEVPDRSCVLGQFRKRPKAEHLIETHLDVHHVALQKTDAPLQLFGRLNIAIEDLTPQGNLRSSVNSL